MKKRLCVLLIVITLCSLAACGAAAASASEQTQPALPAETPLPTREPTPLPTAEPTPQPLSENETGELDLTGMSGTMLYTMIYNMMKQPDDYLGRTIRVKGQFSAYVDEKSGRSYYAVHCGCRRMLRAGAGISSGRRACLSGRFSRAGDGYQREG